MTPRPPEVADVFRRYGGSYREQHGASLSTAQRRAMSAIEDCRTAALGGHVKSATAAAISAFRTTRADRAAVPSVNH